MEEKGGRTMDFSHIVEERIKKAYEEGEFEDLSGMGKPLDLGYLDGIPGELRMAYTILKNAGYVNDKERQFHKELLTIEDLLKKTSDQKERSIYQKRLSKKLIEYQAFLSKRRIPINSSVFKQYQSKIERKLF